MSTKGKAKYNRAIALSKLQKAQRLIAEVNERYIVQANKWGFAAPTSGMTLAGVERILTAMVILEGESQK